MMMKEMLNVSVWPHKDSGGWLWQQHRHLIISSLSLIVSSPSDRWPIRGKAFRPGQSDRCSQSPLWAGSTFWSVCYHMTEGHFDWDKKRKVGNTKFLCFVENILYRQYAMNSLFSWWGLLVSLRTLSHFRSCQIQLK